MPASGPGLWFGRMANIIKSPVEAARAAGMPMTMGLMDGFNTRLADISALRAIDYGGVIPG